MCLYVISKPEQCSGLCPSEAVAPENEIIFEHEIGWGKWWIKDAGRSSRLITTEVIICTVTYAESPSCHAV
jgi:hypothetical protein